MVPSLEWSSNAQAVGTLIRRLGVTPKTLACLVAVMEQWKLVIAPAKISTITVQSPKSSGGFRYRSVIKKL